MDSKFLQLIRQNWAYLEMLSRQLAHDEQDAQDLFQDTMLRLILHEEHFQDGTNFKAWSHTIMKNIFINEYRKRKRRLRLWDEGHALPQLRPTDSFNDGEARFAETLILNSVNLLSDKLREPLLLFNAGYKYEEIADQMGTSLGTIKSRIFHARRSLQKKLGHWPAPAAPLS